MCPLKKSVRCAWAALHASSVNQNAERNDMAFLEARKLNVAKHPCNGSCHERTDVENRATMKYAMPKTFRRGTGATAGQGITAGNKQHLL
jgi:hypothetical protein